MKNSKLLSKIAIYTLTTITYSLIQLTTYTYPITYTESPITITSEVEDDENTNNAPIIKK